MTKRRRKQQQPQKRTACRQATAIKATTTAAGASIDTDTDTNAGRNRNEFGKGMLLGMASILVLGIGAMVLGSHSFLVFATAAQTPNPNHDATQPTTTTTTTTTITPITTAIFDRDWELIETYPHDRTSFTQGLEIYPSPVIQDHCGVSGDPSSSSSCPPLETYETTTTTETPRLPKEEEEEENVVRVLESTGMHGASKLRIWDLSTGTVLRETALDDRFFGEGATLFLDPATGTEKIAVLTYQEGSILVYDAHTLELLEVVERWPSPTTTKEGWGIAFDASEGIFYVTDGSEYIHFWNTSFHEIRPKMAVRLEKLVVEGDGNSRSQSSDVVLVDAPGKRLGHLNELEWDASTKTLLANKWFEEVVLRIDPSTGIVTRVYDFSRLWPKHTRGPQQSRTDDVFNGIAILPNTDGKEWLVTGKYWPGLYRIRIHE